MNRDVPEISCCTMNYYIRSNTTWNPTELDIALLDSSVRRSGKVSHLTNDSFACFFNAAFDVVPLASLHAQSSGYHREPLLSTTIHRTLHVLIQVKGSEIPPKIQLIDEINKHEQRSIPAKVTSAQIIAAADDDRGPGLSVRNKFSVRQAFLPWTQSLLSDCLRTLRCFSPELKQEEEIE